MSRVDVIIPVYNTPFRFLSVALDSLRAQSFTDWTAWIINDASEGSYTQELVKRLEDYNDSRFQYLYSDHKGPAGSRNVGISHGKAPYIAFLDSDDLWMPLILERHISHLEKNNALALVHAHYELIDTEGARLRSVPPHRDLNALGVSELFAALLRENFVSTSSVVVRRRVVEEVGGFDDTFPCLVDKDLWLRILNRGARFYYDPEVLFQYRLHPQNISKRTDLLLATRLRIIAKAEELIRGNPAFADIRWKRLKNDMLHHMHAEAAEGYLERGETLLALKHSTRNLAGLSRNSFLLFTRTVYGAIRRLCTRINSRNKAD